jgi:hypothetical protein
MEMTMELYSNNHAEHWRTTRSNCIKGATNVLKSSESIERITASDRSYKSHQRISTTSDLTDQEHMCSAATAANEMTMYSNKLVGNDWRAISELYQQ